MFFLALLYCVCVKNAGVGYPFDSPCDQRCRSKCITLLFILYVIFINLGFDQLTVFSIFFCYMCVLLSFVELN